MEDQNKDIKESLVEEKENWTSVDLYYRGFHIKKSISANASASSLKTMIDDYISQGFEPSWNMDTSKQHLPQVQEDLGVCDKCGAKNLRSLKGKVYCSAKCWLK